MSMMSVYRRPVLLCIGIVVQSDNAAHLNPAAGGKSKIDLYIAASWQAGRHSNAPVL